MQTLQTNAEDKSSWLQLLLHSQTSTEILLHYKIFVKTLSCIKSWAKCIKLQYKFQFVRIMENLGELADMLLCCGTTYIKAFCYDSFK